MDDDGRNALDFAMDNMFGHDETIVKLLKEKGVVSQTVNCLNDEKVENDVTSEHIVEMLAGAIVDSDVKFVRLLTQTGTDISTVSWGEGGWNALHKASTVAKTTDILDVILETGKFDINYRDEEGRTALHFALNAKNMTTARYLLENGADPTIRDKNEVTPFHLAASHATTTDIIKLILKGSLVDISSRDDDGMTTLHYAIEASNVITARYLLKKGADPTIRDYNDYYTPFHCAAINSKESDMLDLLLKSEYVDINETRCRRGSTALHFAITASNLTAARFLLEKGANPNVVDENGLTPLHEAVFLAKDMDIVELLLNHKDTNVNLLENSGNNSLHYAKYNKHGLSEGIANRLKEKGAISVEEEIFQDNLLDEYSGEETNDENMVNKAVLNMAIVDSNMVMVRFLIETGADISTVTWGEEGWNALHAASIGAKKTELLDVILATGKFNINDADVNGMTALRLALGAENMTTARYLLGKGADPTLSDNEGIYPLHLAARLATTTDIISLILKGSLVDINSRDVSGMTALHYATGASNIITARYLLEKGADPTIRDKNEVSPFQLAAMFSKNSDILDLLLAYEKKINIDERNNAVGMTALHMSIMYSNVTAARFLLSKEANPNVADENGVTPLHLAATLAKDMAIVKLLVNHKDTNVNLLDNKGNNALHYAMDNMHGLGEEIVNLLRKKMAAKAEGSNYKPKKIAALVPGLIEEDSYVKTIRFLIENGQDVSALTWGENGANALHLAAANEETTELIDIILETGQCNINGVDSDGRTPLHYAINRPDPVTINARRLIKMGANTNIADKNGVTPLHMAARNAETMDLIEIFLKTEKLNVNDYDHNGLTAFAYARSNKHGLGQRIIGRLRESGANEW
ncbi:serine/threonine-protein phosphatase 6 regulatory ankyrin repeat subunit B-like [Daphnia pulex]|uniref:serine/threonine-protein phosphatase 6 regulatory ankyrin repeat subunit B-like n=1 Tax=Daphnia pulex TaxID=6669 RepID=UPI001EDF6BEE|nr:serine/threonine-protein phosphatase 6 regulatory ankyrin repeat subunit B-like [Daphnia pulex]